MRAPRLVLAGLLGLVALAAPAAAAWAATDTAASRRPGLWESTMTLQGPHAHVMITRICTDAALERRYPTFGGAGRNTDCPTREMHRTATGATFRSVCVRNGVTTATAGTVTGDFNSRYRVEAVTRISAAGGQPGRERRTTIDNRWLGPCPAGRKPGDLILPNGQVMSMSPAR